MTGLEDTGKVKNLKRNSKSQIWTGNEERQEGLPKTSSNAQPRYAKRKAGYGDDKNSMCFTAW